MRLQELLFEAESIGYENWDHQIPADYSKHLEKTFGEPDEITNEQTVWHHKDGFKRIVCRDEYILHGSPAPHYDFIYSYIDLEVPETMSDELAECSGSIIIDHLKNEVGARCGSLTANAVTLNFCLDVVAGRAKPVKEEYEKRIIEMKDLFADGKTYSNDWWPDESGDANPKNPFYAESVTLEDNQDFHEEYGYLGYADMFEAEYQGRKVKLNKPMRGDVKKFKVYVKNPKGNVVKVNFGDPNMRIKKSNPARRRSFRARHNCDNPGPKHKARYWACRKWQYETN